MSDEYKYGSSKLLGTAEVASGLLAILCVVAMIVVPTNRYYTSTIHIQQAHAYMWEIRASTNLTQMAGYFQNALDLLAPFNGQAVWMDIAIPTVDTDFDVIKTNLQQAINTCEVFRNVPQTNTTYQFMVTNMQLFSDEMADHLASSPTSGNSLQYWNTWDSSTTIWFWLSLVGVLVLLVLCVIFHNKRTST